MLNARYVTGLIFILLCFLLGVSTASSKSERYHRDFWYPMLHLKRLNYCLSDRVTCGKLVANRYCNLMGYARSDEELIEHNIGCSNYLESRLSCHHWKCNGFKKIRCVNKITHKPAASYYYRSKKFVLPRYNQFRIDWCLEKKKGCGHQAAYSYCRRLGYMKTIAYTKAKHVPATKTLQSQDICFGSKCNGFREIICYR